MTTVLGLIGIFLWIIGVMALAAGVAWVVIRLTPTERWPADPSQSSICKVAIGPAEIAAPSNAVREIPRWPITEPASSRARKLRGP